MKTQPPQKPTHKHNKHEYQVTPSFPLMEHLSYFLALLLALLIVGCAAQSHGNNHAVIVSSSRYWFNYRHTANALTFYKLLKEIGGFEDDHIILMLADEYAVNPRNVFKNRILASGKNGPSLYDASTEIDYRGDDVTVQNLANVLTGRQESGLPVLQSDAESNIFIYWTGHGGDQFFKFQDVEEIMSQHFQNVLQQMHASHRYNEILFVADTCQAFTLGDKLDVPNVTVIGSSMRDQSSYAHHSDYDIGLSVIERYTYALDKAMRRNSTVQKKYWYDTSIKEGMVNPFTYKELVANVGVRDDLAVRKIDQVPLSDFFLNVERKDIGKVPSTTSAQLLPQDEGPSLFSFRNQQPIVKIGERQVEQPAHFSSPPESEDSLFVGMEPTETPFLLAVALLLLLVSLACRQW